MYSKKYDGDDDDDIKILLEEVIDRGTVNNYERIPETRAEQTPEPSPEPPKDDD